MQNLSDISDSRYRLYCMQHGFQCQPNALLNAYLLCNIAEGTNDSGLVALIIEEWSNVQDTASTACNMVSNASRMRCSTRICSVISRKALTIAVLLPSLSKSGAMF